MISRVLFVSVALGILLPFAVMAGGGSESPKTPPGSEAFWLDLERRFGEAFPAVVVLDEARSVFDFSSGAPYTDVHETFAILDPIAGSSYGEHKIMFYKSQNIQNLKVFVQREKQKPEQLDQKYILEKDLWKGLKQTIIAIPKLEKRMLIDFSYRRNRYFALSHYFGAGIPVLKSRFELWLPEDVLKDSEGWERVGFIKRHCNLNPETRNETIPGKFREQAIKVFAWELDDVPAFSGGELCPPAADRMPFIAFDVSPWSAWGEYAERSAKEFEEKVLVEGEAKKKALELTASIRDSVEKGRAVLEYIHHEIECAPYEVGYMTPQEVEKTFTEKKGDCADVNALLVSMLRSIGINACPVLVRWRSSGALDPRVVEPGGIDWQIACATIGGKTYMLDGGHKLCPFGLLPDDVEGTLALRLEKDAEGGGAKEAQFIKLPVSGPESNRVIRRTELVLRDDGGLEGVCRERRTGLRAYLTRSYCRKTTGSDLKAYYEKKFSGMVRGAVLSDYSFESLEEDDAPLGFTAKFASDSYFFPGDSQISLCPGELVEASTKPRLEKEEEFKEYRPEFPHCWSACDSVLVRLPQGYRVGSLPEPVTLNTQYYRYSVRYSMPSSKDIVFVRELEIKVCKPDLEFAKVKEILDQFAEKDAECIVVERQ
jgi:hypothetical protein